MRLNKYLAKSGIASRRKSDELIKMATTTVNNEIILDPAYDVNDFDEIRYDGKLLQIDKEKIEIAASICKVDLLSDLVGKILNTWGGLPDRPTAYGGYPAHANSASKPTGGNQGNTDGSVNWYRFEQMFFVHSWNPGGRQYYIYQDDLGEQAKQGKVVKAKL
mgnify:CR=1 FL=1